jgi:hypothetical protein
MPELKAEYKAMKKGKGLRGLKGQFYAKAISPNIANLSRSELEKMYYGNRVPRRRRKTLPAPVVEELESQVASGYFY